MPFFSIVGKEYNLSAGSTRRCRQSAGKHASLLLSLLVEHRVEQLVELVGLATQQCCLLVNLALAQQVHGNLHHGRTGALAVSGLQEPQLAFLHGELHVLHVMVMLLQFVLKSVELCKNLGHGLFHRRILACPDRLIDALLRSPAA